MADSAAADSVVGASAGRTRLAPSGPLAPFVEYYWIARWDLRGQPSYEQTILPHPDVHLVFEASGAGIYGVDRSPFARRLSGQGKAVGVRFRAGCFRPFWGAPISQLSDRVTPATRLFGPLAEKTRQAIMCAETDADMASHAESLLFSGLPEPDPVAEQVAGLVALITSDASLRRVDQLSAVSGLSTRGLQRNFADYVGVSPKWVMRWARLHEAAARADRGEPVDWAVLAVDLGYADQAHLTRDFTAMLGVPPSRYATALLAAAGTVRRFGRGRPLSSACRISATTAAGCFRICLGVKGSTMMPYLPMRRCRSSVRAWSCGDMCHSRESTSTATPNSGHHASGVATNVSPASIVALKSGIGSPDRASRSLRSPSAADLIPTATSVSASRNNAEPALGPALSSATSSGTSHRFRCTASAMTARTSRRLVKLRTVSATARGARAYRIGPNV